MISFRFLTSMCLAASLALGGSLTATAATELRGTTPSGASFVIAVPDGWQAGGPLVFINRGFSFDYVTDPSLGPLEEMQLAQGYALAASGFRQRGWALFHALDDNAELLERFRTRFGEPGSLYVAGGSMGGLISLKQAEDPRFAAKTKGVLALCAPALGARTWDYAFDLRMIYDRICDGVGGGELLTGAPPLPYALDLDDIPDDLHDLSLNGGLLRSLARVTQCTGLLLPSQFRNPMQVLRLEQLKLVSGLRDEDFIATNLGYAIFGMSELVRAPDKLDARGPFDNRYVEYATSGFDSGIVRYAADPFAALDLRAASDLRGAGTARIVSLTTSRDELVVPQHLDALTSTYPSSRLTAGFVTEPEASHCGFNDAELAAGWNALREWSNGAPQPTVAAIQSRCVAAGGGSDCRIDANADPATPVRLQARDWTVPFDISGSWFDPSRSGEGIVIEAPRTRDGAVLVSWYTYNAAGAPGGEQLWIIGAGELYDNTVRVRDAYIARGPRFVAANQTKQLERWGSLDIAFDSVTDGADATGQGRAHVRWIGPGAFGSGERTMIRPTYLGATPAAPANGDAAPVHRSGTYTIPGRDGHGVVLQQDIVAGGAKRSFLTWYTYDIDGNPMWLTGAQLAGNALVFDVIVTRGTRFGSAFNAADVVRVPWGRVTLSPSGCGATGLTSIAWQANDPAYGSGELPLERLSDPRGALSLTPPLCE
jgi:hypothetical protein